MLSGGISAGIMTLTPPEALGYTTSSENYLGFMSTCSFVPFSTLMLFGMAFIGLLLLIKLIKSLRKKFKASKIYLSLKTLTGKIR